jgi:hypothetical protein
LALPYGDSEDIEPRQPEGRRLLDADADARRCAGDALKTTPAPSRLGRLSKLSPCRPRVLEFQRFAAQAISGFGATTKPSG